MLTSEEMPLEMLGMQVGLVAMRTRELPVRILDRRSRGLGRAIDPVYSVGSSRDAGENSSPSLRPYHLSARWLLGKVGRGCRRHGVGGSPHGSFVLRVAIGARLHAILLSSIPWWRRGNELGVRLGGGVWWHHAVLLVMLRRRMVPTKERRRHVHTGMRRGRSRRHTVDIIRGGRGVSVHIIAIWLVLVHV